MKANSGLSGVSGIVTNNAVPPPANRLYPRIGLSFPGTITNPPISISPIAWTQYNSAAVLGSSKYLHQSPGSSQLALTPSWAAITGSTTTLLHAQFLSDPLATQPTVSAKIVAFAATLTNAASDFTWRGQFFMRLIDGTTGIGKGAAGGSSIAPNRTSTTEVTCFHMFTFPFSSIVDGDYFDLEIGIRVVKSPFAAVVPSSSIYADGTTDIATNNVATLDAKSFIQFSVPLAFL